MGQFPQDGENEQNAAKSNQQILANIDLSLKCYNSASSSAIEEVKKGKSSEFNPQNYEQVKSSPSLKVWSHESVKDTVKFNKWVNLRGVKK